MLFGISEVSIQRVQYSCIHIHYRPEKHTEKADLSLRKSVEIDKLIGTKLRIAQKINNCILPDIQFLQHIIHLFLLNRRYINKKN